jgi:hypothetical protein
MRLKLRFVAIGAAAQQDLEPGTVVQNCTSRTGAPRQESSLGTLSEDLKQVLFDAEPQILRWLTASQDHVEAFVQDPIGALVQVGVELDRSQQKALLREREGRLAGETQLPGFPEPILFFEVDPTLPQKAQPKDTSHKDNLQDADQAGG